MQSALSNTAMHHLQLCRITLAPQKKKAADTWLPGELYCVLIDRLSPAFAHY